MKEWRVALILSVLAFGLPALTAGAAPIKDDPGGFNGYTWGTPLAKFPAFKLVRDLGSTDFVNDVGVYENPGETLALNEVPLSEIRYRFVENQLESIVLVYTGRENRDKLMRWLEERYGKVSLHERKMVNAVQWFGVETTVSLSYDYASQRGKLYFVSQTLNNRFNEFHQATQGD